MADESHAGWRLDRFLSHALPDFSRSRLQQLLEAGAVSSGARTIKDANHRVKPGDAFALDVPPTAPAIPQGQDIPLTVIYEDKELIVIDKPAGLVVHPAAGNPDGTLVNALIGHCGRNPALQEITEQAIGFIQLPVVCHPYGAGIEGQFAESASQPFAAHHCCNAA